MQCSHCFQLHGMFLAFVKALVRCREVSRRTALLTQAAAASMLLQAKLAAAADAAKQTNLPIEQLKDIIAHDFQTGQYYITGNLTQSVFADDCVFQDPTTRVHGPEYYSTAVAKLFDQETSRADLISIEVHSLLHMIQMKHAITCFWNTIAFVAGERPPHHNDQMEVCCRTESSWQAKAKAVHWQHHVPNQLTRADCRAH